MTTTTQKLLSGIMLSIPVIIWAMIAFPCLVKSDLKDGAAYFSMKELYDAEKKFYSENRMNRYANLGELFAAGFIDKQLASGLRDGFKFEVESKQNGFEAFAVPFQPHGLFATGVESFYINEKGILTHALKDGSRAN